MNQIMHTLRGIVGSIRNAVALGIVSSVNDGGAAQTVTLQTGDGVIRGDVEVMQPFGFSSVPPPGGAIAVVIAQGADPGNLMALPLSNPSARFAGLQAGEAVMYAGDGSRVHLRAGGVIEIWGGASVTIYSKTTVIDAPNGCTINGDVTVNGNLTTSGNLSDSHGSLDRLRGNYNEHVHPPSGTPPSPTDPE